MNDLVLPEGATPVTVSSVVIAQVVAVAGAAT